MDFFEYSENLNNSEFIDQYTYMCKHPRSTQNKVLQAILHENRSCEYGEKYNFGDIKTAEEFRMLVPKTNWSAYDTYNKSMQNGKSNILFNGVPEYFMVTSGTTGKPKYMPESKLGRKAKKYTQRLMGIRTMGVRPWLTSGKVLPIVNNPFMKKTKCGLNIGGASGLILINSKRPLEDVAYPVEILGIQDQDAMDYALMRFSIEQDVRTISVNNAGRMRKLFSVMFESADNIIEDIRRGTLSEEISISSEIREKLRSRMKPNPIFADELQRLIKKKDKLLPSDYWPNLTLFKCWLDGSVGRYLKQVKPMLNKNIIFMDIGYGSTECKFNIPMMPNDAAGPLSLLGAFFEFEPINNTEKTLLAHELKDGEQYKLIITTFAGLYRYCMGDIIRVKGFTGKTPNVLFENKTNDFGNISNERLSGKALIDSVEKVAGSVGIKIWHVCGVTDFDNCRYDICIEVENDSIIPNRKYLNDLEDEIRTWSVAYNIFYKQGILRPARLVIMRNGWQKALYELSTKSGQSIEQVKLPIFYDKLPLNEYIISVVE